MKKKNLFLLVSSSILTGAIGSLLLSKKKEEPVDYKEKYIGKYSFSSPQVQRKTNHILEINDDLTLTIDSIPMEGNLLSIDHYHLVVQDKFGYKIVVETDGHSPISLTDEAEESIAILKRLS